MILSIKTEILNEAHFVQNDNFGVAQAFQPVRINEAGETPALPIDLWVRPSLYYRLANLAALCSRAHLGHKRRRTCFSMATSLRSMTYFR
jgi:hypothetical protein